MGLAPNQSRRVLRGGARLLTATLPDRASASVVLMFKVGSRFEDDRIGGISHFIEHLFFKGTRKRPTAKAIAEAIEGVGGWMNASTDKEVTVYLCRVPAERLELAVDVLCDIVSDSQFAPTDIERERLVILEELKMYLDQPQDYVHSLFERIMWPDHPLGRDIIGTMESVSSTSRDDLTAYVHSHSSQHADDGYFAVYMGVDPHKAEEAVAGVQEELRRISEELVPDQELIKAKEFKKGSLRLGLESTTSLASWLCQQELLIGEVRTAEEIIGLVEAIEAEDLRRVARRVLDQPLQLAVIGPFESDAPFRAAAGL